MKESTLAKMAWRNLWRHRRRTLITLSSIAFGILLSVLFTGLGDRTYGDMIDLAARMGSGHVTLEDPTYLEAPNLKKTVTGVAQKEKAALAIPGVTRVATRIIGFTMLSTASNSAGVFFMGIDPTREGKRSSAFLEALTSGNLFASSKNDGIVVGTELARNLDLDLGSKVVYTLTDKTGEMVTGLARVSGMVRTGVPGFDASFCMLPLDTIRGVLGYGADEATQVAIFISDQRDAKRVAAAMAGQIGKETAAVTWDQNQPELAGFIGMKVGGTRFLEIVIMILIAAGIFNTLFVSVMERMRELGILMAIGFSPKRLFRLVMWESLFLGLTGLVTGALVTLFPYYWFATRGVDMSKMVGEKGAEVAGVVIDPIMRVGIFPENAALIATAALLATLLSGLYPAWKAGRVEPVQSIKLV